MVYMIDSWPIVRLVAFVLVNNFWPAIFVSVYSLYCGAIDFNGHASYEYPWKIMTDDREDIMDVGTWVLCLKPGWL